MKRRNAHWMENVDHAALLARAKELAIEARTDGWVEGMPLMLQEAAHGSEIVRAETQLPLDPKTAPFRCKLVVRRDGVLFHLSGSGNSRIAAWYSALTQGQEVHDEGFEEAWEALQ